MDKYACVAHGSGDDTRFYVHRMDEAEAVEAAKDEATRLGQPSVTVENLQTDAVAYDGPVADVGITVVR
jgi:hypothetical protein